MSNEELEKLVVTLEEEMFAAAEELRFEYAAKLRDEIKELRRELQAAGGAGRSPRSGVPPGKPCRFALAALAVRGCSGPREAE